MPLRLALRTRTSFTCTPPLVFSTSRAWRLTFRTITSVTLLSDLRERERVTDVTVPSFAPTHACACGPISIDRRIRQTRHPRVVWDQAETPPERADVEYAGGRSRGCSASVSALLVPVSTPSAAHHFDQAANRSEDRTVKSGAGQAPLVDEPRQRVGSARYAAVASMTCSGSPSPCSRQSGSRRPARRARRRARAASCRRVPRPVPLRG